MHNIIFDYFDGATARKYNQVSYFGEVFDWIADLTAYATVLLWWSALEPELLILFFTLFCLETLTMMTDTVARCHGYSPKI